MQSYLKKNAFYSPLQSTTVIRPNESRSKKALVATLVLTSLVDAFSILVIYLLINTSAATEQLDIDKDITLPMATQSEVLQAGVVVTTVNGEYKIKTDTVKSSDLHQTLLLLNEELKTSNDERQKNLVIQADKMANFELINPIILAGTQAGFENIRFAVLPKEGQ